MNNINAEYRLKVIRQFILKQDKEISEILSEDLSWLIAIATSAMTLIDAIEDLEYDVDSKYLVKKLRDAIVNSLRCR